MSKPKQSSDPDRAKSLEAARRWFEALLSQVEHAHGALIGTADPEKMPTHCYNIQRMLSSFTNGPHGLVGLCGYGAEPAPLSSAITCVGGEDFAWAVKFLSRLAVHQPSVPSVWATARDVVSLCLEHAKCTQQADVVGGMTQGVSSKGHTGRQTRRGKREPRPLTERQAEALTVVSECRGSFTEAGKVMGCTAPTVRQHFLSALNKLPAATQRHYSLVLKKNKQQAMPTSRRGQEDVYRDPDGGAHHGRQASRRPKDG